MNKVFQIILRISLFAIVLGLTILIVKIFYSEQATSLKIVAYGQYKSIAANLQEEINVGAGLTGELGKINTDEYSKEIDSILENSKDAKDLKIGLNDIIERMRVMGAKSNIIEEYKRDLTRANTIYYVTTNAGYLSVIFYIIIYATALWSFIFVVFFSQSRIKTRFAALMKDFEYAASVVSLNPSVDYIAYYRNRTAEMSMGNVYKINGLLNYLTNLGLLGTLFGLTLAFYTAASSFPADVGKMFQGGENQLVVVSGLIQTIYNYAFAVITSLVAYSLSICLRLLSTTFRVDLIGKFDSIAMDRIRILDTAAGATERAIVEYVKGIMSKSEIEDRLKGTLSDVIVFFDATRKTIEEEIAKLKLKIIETSKSIEGEVDNLKKGFQKSTEETERLNVRVKGLEVILQQLQESSALMRTKLDGIISEMKK